MRNHHVFSLYQMLDEATADSVGECKFPRQEAAMSCWCRREGGPARHGIGNCHLIRWTLMRLTRPVHSPLPMEMPTCVCYAAFLP